MTQRVVKEYALPGRELVDDGCVMAELKADRRLPKRPVGSARTTPVIN